MEKTKKSGFRIGIRVIGWLLCLILGSLLICNLTIIIKGIIHPDMPPSVLGITPMVVMSGSMSGDAKDHIEPGDLILVGKADINTLKEGDVISFKEGNSVVTHRIVKVQVNDDGEIEFITKGDANNTEDVFPVNQYNLIGICKGRIPKLGEFALFLQTPYGMIGIFGLFLLMFVAYDMLYRRKQKKIEKNRTAELEAEIARLKGERHIDET